MGPLFNSVLSGFLASSAFPPAALWFLSAFSLVPLFRAVSGSDTGEAFRLGWFFGLTYFGLMLWWLAPTISRFGHMPIYAAIPVIGLLVCYLALFPAVWSAVASMLLSGINRLWAGLTLALLWGALEWLRGGLLSGFPWGAVSYALAPQPLLFQSVDIYGPYALSAVVVFFNFLVWDVTTTLSPERPISARIYADLCMIFIILGLVGTYGITSMVDTSHADRGYPELHVAAIQGSLPQEEKWAPGIQQHTVDLYREMTLKAVRELPPDAADRNGVLVVWPETSLPFFYQTGRELSRQVRETARQARAAILFGSPAFKADGKGERSYLNRAYLINDRGMTEGSYDKMHLVPFGEYLPWGWLTSWARELVPDAGDFSAGRTNAPLCWKKVRVGVLICFESIFPELARESVALGANCLAVMTNDSWFGDTGAPWQHADMAAFRAVENRRWLIRAANTGVSEIIAPTGQVVAKSSLFRQDIITSTIRLRDDMTVYQRYGDLPLVAAAMVLFMPAIYAAWRRS